MLKVLQHNLNKQDTAQHSIFEIAISIGTDILLLQEPYLPKNSKTNGYICLQHPAFYPVLPQQNRSLSDLRIKPRVITYIRKEAQLQFSPRYDLCSDPDCQIIEVYNSIEPFYIINIYNERRKEATMPNATTTVTLTTTETTTNITNTTTAIGLAQDYTIKRILYGIDLQNKPTLIAGDFNLHHYWWNALANPAKISKALELVEWLQQKQAILLNDPEEININGGTFFRRNLKDISVIDLAFSIGFNTISWGNWRYLENTGSDHEVIGFSANINPTTTTTTTTGTTANRTFYNYKKADWDLFQEALL